MSRDVLFVSWCPLKLLRPRALQVGRVGKALRRHSWRPTLICAEFDNYTYLFDREVESWYRPEFSRIIALPDPEAQLFPAAEQDQSGHPKSWWSRKFGRSSPVPSWTNSASEAIGRWVRWRRHPVVFSFAQPWISHLAVLAVKRRFPQIRWAAHFSDPWVDSPYLGQTEGANLADARQQEREIIDRADAVIFVTEQTSDLVMRKYPQAWRGKTHVIPHLLDLEVPRLPKVERKDVDQLRFVHAGSLYEGTRAPGGLFEALKELQQSASGGRLPLGFHFVGWTGSATLKSVSDLLPGQCVSWTSPLYYTPSLKELANSDVLVVVDADFQVSPFLPSKIFDYLLFDKPMMALTPSGSATSQFMEDLGYPCVGPNDIEGIKKLLMATLEKWKAGKLKPTAAHMEARKEFDVRSAGNRYVELIERLSR